MKKLIKYFSYLLLKGPLFWTCLAFTEIVIIGLFLPALMLGPKGNIVGHFDKWSMLGLLLSFIAVCSYSTGVLFPQKAIQDTVSTGFSRRQVYFAKTLINVIFCTVILAINLLTIYVLVYGFGNTKDAVLFDDIPAKFFLTFVVCLFYIVLLTSLAFITKNPVGSIMLGWLIAFAGSNIIVYFLTVPSQKGFNFLYFFNNFFFRQTFFLKKANDYVLPVTGIYIIIILFFYFLGERSFRKADLN
jgi:hypothetical protein